MIILFNTARFSGGKCLDYMKEQIKEIGGNVIDHFKFRKLFWIGTKKAIQFGKRVQSKNLMNETCEFKNNENFIQKNSNIR